MIALLAVTCIVLALRRKKDPPPEEGVEVTEEKVSTINDEIEDGDYTNPLASDADEIGSDDVLSEDLDEGNDLI